MEPAIRIDQSRAGSGMRRVRIQSVNNSKLFLEKIISRNMVLIHRTYTRFSIGDIFRPSFDTLCKRLIDLAIFPVISGTNDK